MDGCSVHLMVTVTSTPARRRRRSLDSINEETSRRTIQMDTSRWGPSRIYVVAVLFLDLLGLAGFRSTCRRCRSSGWMMFQKASSSRSVASRSASSSREAEEVIDLAKKYKNSDVAKCVPRGLEFAYEAHGASAQGHDTVSSRCGTRGRTRRDDDDRGLQKGPRRPWTTRRMARRSAWDVIGIINAFCGMVASGAGGLGSASAARGSLATTCSGLFVAIRGGGSTICSSTRSSASRSRCRTRPRSSSMTS